MIREGQAKNKKQGKNSKVNPQAGMGKGKKSPQNPPPKKNEKFDKDDKCFECVVMGHWKKKFPKYLDDLKNNEVRRALQDYLLHQILGYLIMVVELIYAIHYSGSERVGN
uniref:Zinc finger, CCHC-type n=1 Tax=Lactuca sativa TaxID=4236 RepID=A0A9R1V8G8_LACSA|nr:hypothetical protein LSAT_V11C600309150 [Lactuca sativa]